MCRFEKNVSDMAQRLKERQILRVLPYDRILSHLASRVNRITTLALLYLLDDGAKSPRNVF